MSKHKKKLDDKPLRAATKEWIKSVEDKFILDNHHKMILRLAGQAWDRATEARNEISKNGLTYLDRFGQPHASPACKIENDSMIIFSRLIRELDLDGEQPTETPRPPMIRR